ncbi:MAG: hypothetical protein RXR02_03885 [Thermoproteus sp.]
MTASIDAAGIFQHLGRRNGRRFLEALGRKTAEMGVEPGVLYVGASAP